MTMNRLGGVLGRLRESAAGADRLPDHELLDRFVRRCDPFAFETLLARHGPMVLAVCRRALHDPAAADDAFQATFLVLLQKASSLRRGELLGNWLYGVACRTVARAKVDAARRQRREGATPPRTPPDLLAEITARELVVAVDEELLRLPARYRAPLVACYLEGRTRDEAASELGWSLATLGRRLGRGRDLLRLRLARRGLTLSATLLPTVLIGDALAAVPVRLTTPLLQAATLFAGGSELLTGVVSIDVETLSRRVIGAMFLTKVKTVAVALLAVGLVAIGVGRLADRVLSGPTAQAAEAPPKVVQAPAEQPKDEATRHPVQAALDTINGVENKAERAGLLLFVAEDRMFHQDKDGSRAALRQALELIDAVEGDAWKELALRSAVEIRLRLHDDADAAALVTKFQGEANRNRFRAYLATVQTNMGNVWGARETLGTITDDQRENVLAAIAVGEARWKRYADALKIADALKAPLVRAGALEGIALAQGEWGEHDGAAKSLREALRLYDATLTDAKKREDARAEIAIKQARTGDIEGARQTAAKLEFDKESTHRGRGAVLQAIASEQAKKGDMPGAYKTLDELPNPEARVAALVSVAQMRMIMRSDQAGFEKDLAAARTLADSAPADRKAILLGFIDSVRADFLARAGDIAGALEVARGLKRDDSRCWALMNAARAQVKAGDPKAARATLGPAMKAADALPEVGDPKTAVALLPAQPLAKGRTVRDLATVLTQAGGEEEARAWAARQRSAIVKVAILLGIANGMPRPDAGGKKPLPHLKVQSG